MAQTPLRQLFRTAADHAANYRASLDDRRVGPSKTAAEVRSDFQRPLNKTGRPADEVIEELVSVADGGLVSTAGPRYFGFVIGGALPAASAAEILATGWDQNAWSTVLSPTAAAAEQAAGSWLKELLGLPPTVSAGFVTGAQAANTVGLAAARHHVLAKAGWDVEVDGLNGAPRVRILVGDERHASIDRSLRLLGFGSRSIELVRTKANGVIDLDDLQRLLEQQAPGPTTPTSAHPATSAGASAPSAGASAPSAGASAPSAEPARREQGPLIVCLQAGNVNTGASDSLGDACRIVHEYGGWVHVDGAFGLWAAASPAVRDQVAGLEQADSWGCDGHKWLNLPYDSGFVFCAYPDSHAAALAYSASYLLRSEERETGSYAIDSSRRSRGLAVWAGLQELGRDGVTEVVDRCCAMARRFAEQLQEAGCEIGNDVVLNQVIVSFGADDETDRVIAAVQEGGVCWMGGTTWRGRRYMRISVSNHLTTETDVDRSVQAILTARTP